MYSGLCVLFHVSVVIKQRADPATRRKSNIKLIHYSFVQYNLLTLRDGLCQRGSCSW